MSAISPKDGPVAVTGCSGFTGGHMVRELILQGYKVRACIRDESSWRGQDCVNYLSRLPNVDIINGCDLFTPGSYDEAFKGCSAVFHVAAVLGNSADGKSQPTGSGDVSKDVYEGGMVGTKNVIDAINASGSVKRMVYTSSMAAVSGARGATVPDGYEWTETDWASDEVDPERWNHPRNAYSKSKVDTEHFINDAADASGGKWDAITMNPAMICGPILFKAQVGQWIEQIGRLAGGLDPSWPSKYDMYYNIIDVRDLVKAHRLAAESEADHKNSHGGPRYVMHGSGGRSALRFGTEVAEIIHEHFPRFVLGKPATVTSEGKPITIASKVLNDCKKAKSVLGATIRPVEETIRDVVETSIELGVITPKLAS
ncbi:MAG: NAD-dependent epimerase/dehydratase family protein [Proteobacteria bacterium]|jgi:dihydroflavonol-4-reductase|nr:NAD-dependent epimerase/dehydratase family protein [Pseudomonadota bacterium]MDA1299476.1 NAD-dependent epimerase/dehydratase family protein [Pseudomonadota bacterium]